MTDLEVALDRAQGDNGELVGRVYCADCGSEKTLAKVRTSSEGLYFEAVLPRGVTGDSTRVPQQQQDARASGVRLPFLGAVSLRRYLLERESVDQDYPPRAECPKHGVAKLDPEALIEAVRSAPGVAVVTIHGPKGAHR